MSAQPGTGQKTPVIQKLHMTEQTNVKIKLNKRAAKLLFQNDPGVIAMIRAKLGRKVFH